MYLIETVDAPDSSLTTLSPVSQPENKPTPVNGNDYALAEFPSEEGVPACVLSGGYSDASFDVLNPDWIPSIQPCSWAGKRLDANEFKILREESGPVMINNYPVSADEHRRALSGEEVELRAFEQEPKILVGSADDLIFDGKSMTKWEKMISPVVKTKYTYVNKEGNTITV